MAGEREIKILCPAKLNLTLKVIGKRDDGFHDIISLMQPITLYDVLRLGLGMDGGEGDGISIDCGGHAGVPEDSTNLAWRAAASFMRETGQRRRVRLEIAKGIPVGAGLGGGSSDAAGVLMGLDRALGPGLGPDALARLALELGSDVPFFLLKRPAIARGRGEALKAVELPELHYVLINPGFSVAAKWAYGNLILTKGAENNILSDLEERTRSAEDLVKGLSNDLEAAVSGKHRIINELKDMLVGSGARAALMSGSGPTVFGVFFTEDEARKAREELKRKIAPGHELFLARGL